MKKLASLLLAVCLCLGLAVVPAAAEEAAAPIVAVQLNGQPLVFTDAVPQLKNQRTFLPFRAVFEALGAQVDYDSGKVTAVRGDVTVSMHLDSTEVHVDRGGTVETFTMDVAPYLDLNTWRTYVPARFAAQALGCMVGWDAAASTAVIIDPEALVQDAMQGLTFTRMEELDAAMPDYEPAAFRIDLDGTVTAMGIPVDMSGVLRGVADDNGSDVTAEMVVSLLGREQGGDISIIQNNRSGKAYINRTGTFADFQNDDSGVWYETDASGAGQLTDLLSGGDPDSVDAYGQLKALLHGVLAVFSDEAFELDEDGDYASLASIEQDDLSLKAAAYLFPVDGKLSAFECALGIESQDAQAPFSFFLDVFADVNGTISMKLYGSLDADGVSFELEFDGAGWVEAATQGPRTQPPADALILPLDAMG